ncbi:hypothetical protein HIM_03302 [Hirsutella minnesotensis 3608]|nr:hypothetical protein HIM_03302 [Hirsutella minnesotensis 3608]
MAAMWKGPMRSSLHASGLSVRPTICNLISPSRSFSHSPATLSNAVPPDSPSYIRLSNPPQSQETERERARGHLPVPREIFPRLEGDKKIRPEYIQNTAPQSSKGRKPSNEVQRWKAKVADSRRKNLQEGLKELWVRRSRSEDIRQRRVTRKFEENKRAAAAPEREDDRLTRTTVLDSILDTKVYPDPHRLDRAKRSHEQLEARENAKREARRDALMELYISASDFIVHENELKEKIDQVFHEDHFLTKSMAFNRYGTKANVWGMHGKPPSIETLLEATSGNSKRVTDFYESEYDRSALRYKKIAEDLTGGKMP